MEIIRTPQEMQHRALALRAEGRRIGFVPTMGYLHEGHLSLIRIAREQADVVIVSIFVNPTQFGPNEDLDNYPRDLEKDEALCGKEAVDILFYPAAKDIYADDFSTYINEERLSSGLCGASRPTHFRGVTTVVAKLFNLTLPHLAVFGEKDAQQLRIIRRMTRDLNFPVKIVSGPIIREPDGLAMSSRNAYLSIDERQQALGLHQALEHAKTLYSNGERRAQYIKEAISSRIENAPLARIDYIEIVDDETLSPIKTIEGPCLVALAVFLGKTRLIDNIVLR